MHKESMSAWLRGQTPLRWKRPSESAVLLCFNGPVPCHRPHMTTFSKIKKGCHVWLWGWCQHVLAFYFPRRRAGASWRAADSQSSQSGRRPGRSRLWWMMLRCFQLLTWETGPRWELSVEMTWPGLQRGYVHVPIDWSAWIRMWFTVILLQHFQKPLALSQNWITHLYGTSLSWLGYCWIINVLSQWVLSLSHAEEETCSVSVVHIRSVVWVYPVGCVCVACWFQLSWGPSSHVSPSAS